MGRKAGVRAGTRWIALGVLGSLAATGCGKIPNYAARLAGDTPPPSAETPPPPPPPPAPPVVSAPTESGPVGPGPVGPIATATSTLSVNPTEVVADGSAIATIELSMNDASGRAIAGATTHLEITGTANTVSQPGPTDGTGVATGSVASTRAETKSITATVTAGTRTIVLVGEVTFVAGPAVASASSIAVAPQEIPADGATVATITITLVDAFGNPASGRQVALAATGAGNILVQPFELTDAAGATTGSLASTVGETKVVYASETDVPLLSAAVTVRDVPATHYAFVANGPGATVSVFRNDRRSGRLIPHSYAPCGGTAPAALALTADGKFLYVANAGSNDVSAFSFDAATGLLKQLGSAVAAGTTPAGITLHPSAPFAYVVNEGSNDVAIYSMDAATGALTAAGSAPTGTGPRSFTIDPSGRFAFVTNGASNDVSAYGIDAQTGALTASGSVPSGVAPTRLVIDPAGRCAYVANQGSNDVSTFAIEASTGALIPSGTIAAGSSPGSLSLDPLGRFLYVASCGSRDLMAFSVDGTTGALASLGAPCGLGATPSAVAADVTGELVFVACGDTAELCAIRVGAGGALTRVGMVRTRSSPTALALKGGPRALHFTPRFVYAASLTDDTVAAYSADPATGGLTLVGAPAPAGRGPSAQVVDPSGRFLFVASSGSSFIATYAIDAATGAITRTSTASPATITPVGLAIEPSGRFLYAVCRGAQPSFASAIQAFSIDPATGALASIGPAAPTGNDSSAPAIDPTGQFVYVPSYDSADLTVFTIGATGALTRTANLPLASWPTSIAIAPSGDFAAVSGGDDTVQMFSIDRTTGALSPVAAGIASAGLYPVQAAFGATGEFLYVVHMDSASVSIFSLDGAGTATLVSAAACDESASAIAFDPSTLFGFVANSGASSIGSYQVNPATGELSGPALTPTGSTPASIAVLSAPR